MNNQPYHPVKRKSPVNLIKIKNWAFLFSFISVSLAPELLFFIFLVTIVIPRSWNYNSKLENKKPRGTKSASAVTMGLEIIYRELKSFLLPEDNNR